MWSIFLNPSYWYAPFPTPLLPRGQFWVLAFGLVYTAILIIGYFVYRYYRPRLNSKVKRFINRIQFSALNLWMMYWVVIFCAWFAVTLFGNKIFILVWGLYFLAKVIYFAWEGRKLYLDMNETVAR